MSNATVVSVRFTSADQLEEVEAGARKASLPVSTFLRVAGLAAARREVRPASVDVEGELVDLKE